MKNLPVLFFAVCLSLSASESLSRMFETSFRENRPLMVLFTAEWCSWCHKLKDEVLTAESVKKELESVLMTVIDSDEYKNIKKKYNVRGLPTTLFFDSRQQEIDRIIGYYPADQFIGECRKILSGKNTFASLKTKVEAGSKDAEVHGMLAEKYLDRNMTAEAEKEYRAALDLGADKGKMIFGLAMTFKESKKFEQAAEYFEKALKIRGDNSDDLFQYLLSAYGAKDYMSCIRICNRMLKIEPENGEMIPTCLYVKGLSFRRMNLKNDSDRHWNELIEMFPEDRNAKAAKKELEKEKNPQK